MVRILKSDINHNLCPQEAYMYKAGEKRYMNNKLIIQNSK